MKETSRLATFVERVDWVLLGLVTSLALLGILNLQSASYTHGMSFHLVQSLWFLFGSIVVAVLAFMDTRIFERWAYVFYGAVILLLVVVAVAGTEFNGSKRWINLGFFYMQPSELLKISVILVTARFFQDKNQNESFTLRGLWHPLLLVVGGVAFVLKQPDLGTSLVVMAIFMTMVLFQGIRWSSLVAIAVAVLISTPLIWNVGLKEYQKDRVVAFLNLEADRYGQSWQVSQSIIAFGSGQLLGKGHIEGTQVQRGFVPEHESDFAATIWGEERGFVGMMFLLSLYLALIGWALRISAHSRDRFGAHVAVGVAALIFWHTLVNLGMVTGMLPVVGITLPFVSYGGSSLLTMMMGVGLLLNISIRRR